MMREIISYYHKYEVEDIQVKTHGWNKESWYAGWESIRNFADTGELTGLVTARVPGAATRKLDNVSAEWGGHEDENVSDAKKYVKSPQAGWGSLNGLTTAQRCTETLEVVSST